jgi:hypothetical protein
MNWTVTINNDTDNPKEVTATASCDGCSHSRRVKLESDDEARFAEECRQKFAKHEEENANKNAAAERIAAQLNK